MTVHYFHFWKLTEYPPEFGSFSNLKLFVDSPNGFRTASPSSLSLPVGTKQ